MNNLKHDRYKKLCEILIKIPNVILNIIIEYDYIFNGKVESILEGNLCSVLAIELLSDGRIVAAGGSEISKNNKRHYDHNIKIFKSNNCVKTISTRKQNIYSMIISHDDKIIVGLEFYIIICDPDTGDIIRHIKTNTNRIIKLYEYKSDIIFGSRDINNYETLIIKKWNTINNTITNISDTSFDFHNSYLHDHEQHAYKNFITLSNTIPIICIGNFIYNFNNSYIKINNKISTCTLILSTNKIIQGNIDGSLTFFNSQFQTLNTYFIAKGSIDKIVQISNDKFCISVHLSNIYDPREYFGIYILDINNQEVIDTKIRLQFNCLIGILPDTHIVLAKDIPNYFTELLLFNPETLKIDNKLTISSYPSYERTITISNTGSIICGLIDGRVEIYN